MHGDHRIEVRNRTSLCSFGPLPGVGALTYRSDRVPGRRAAWELDLARYDVDHATVMIAGHEVHLSAADGPWRWDGTDASARPVGASARASVVLPDGRRRHTALGRFDPRRLGLGGWSPTLLHTFDAAAKLLHLGDGTTVTGVRGTPVSHDAQPAIEVVGRDARHRFTVDGRLLVSDGPGGLPTIVCRWDGETLTGWTDRDGTDTEVDRSTDGEVVLRTGTRTVRLDLDAAGWLTAVTSPGGRRAEVTVRPDGLVTAVAGPGSWAVTVGYDDTGRVERHQPPDEAPVRLVETATDTGRRIVRLSGEGRERSYDLGRTASGGQRRRTRCCGQGEPVTVVREGDTTTTTLPDGTTSVRRRFDEPAPWHTEQQTLTLPSGATVEVVHQSATQPDGTFEQHHRVGDATTSTWRAPDGRLTVRSPEGRTAVVVVDDHGRVVEEHQPGQPTLRVAYDRTGPSRIDVGGATQHLIADDDGNLREAITGTGLRTTFEHDADGFPLAQHLPGDRTIRLGYDATGNLASLTPPSRPPTTIACDAAGRRTRLDQPAIDGRTDPTVQRYDGDGLLIAVEHPDGTVEALQRDVAGRVVEHRLQGGIGPDETLTFTFDPRSGRLVTAAGRGGSVEHVWDGPRVVAEQVTGPVPGRIERAYGPSGLIVAETVAGDDAIAFTHDRDGLVVRAGALELRRDAASGQVQQRRLGRVVETFDRRVDGLVTRRTVDIGGRRLVQVEYGWDERGRLTSVSVYRDGGRARTAYAYDHADRLAAIEVDGAAAIACAYDANGARLRVGDDDAVQVDARDRVVAHGTVRFTHHPGGQRAARHGPDAAVTTYRHDVAGRLRGVDTPSHRVDHHLDVFGRRVLTMVDGAVTRRLLWGSQRHPVAELAADGTVLTRYVSAEPQLTPSYQRRAGRDELIVCDHVGSPWLVIDATSGEVVQELVHDAWGRVVHDTAPGRLPFGFTGGLRDGVTELVHLGARDYDPVTGTFTAPDPLGFAGGSTNLYAYAAGDPVNHVDPTGQQVERCRALSNIGWQRSVGLEHHWARTPEVEAGMGPHPELGGGQTAITDHSGRGDQAGSVCEEVEDVDEECVNRMLATPNTSSSGVSYGRDTGWYAPWNQCQSEIDQVFRACSTNGGPGRYRAYYRPAYTVNRNTATHGGRYTPAPDTGGSGNSDANYTPAPDYTPADGYGSGEGGEAWQ